MELAKVKIGFLSSAMSEFDAVLDVDDVRKEAIPEIEEAEYIKPMLTLLKSYGEVIYPGIVGEQKAAKNARDIFIRKGVDIIIAHEMHYTLDLTILTVFRGCNVPVIIWNTQPFKTLPEDFSFSQAMANDGIAGLPQMTNALIRMGKQFRVITGREDDQKVIEELKKEILVVKIIKNLKSAKIGVIGYIYPGMKTLSIDEIKLINSIGPYTEQIEIEEIKKESDKLTAEEIRKEISAIKESYTIRDLTSDELYQNVKVSCALKKVINRHDVDAVAMLCHSLIKEKGIGVAPCLGASMLTEMNIPFTCECDVPAAVAMLIMKMVTKPWFLEFYSMDMEKEFILLSHCGMGTYSLANDKYAVNLCKQPCFPGPKGSGCAFEFSAKPGEITILSLTTNENGNLKLISFLAEVIEHHPFPMSTPQMFIKFKVKTINDGINEFCQAGSSHHFSVGYGDYRGVFARVADYLGIDHYENE